MSKERKIFYMIFFLIISSVLIAFIYLFLNLRKDNSYNLLIVSIDTLRSDHMGVYGYGKNTTPSMDRWAKEATVFENSFTAVPYTFPSFTALMTGLDPLNTRILTNVYGTKPVSDSTSTLATILKKNNFVTAAFFTNYVLLPKFTNLQKGFDVYKYNSSWKNVESREYENLVTEPISWLKENKNKRFFLWIHLSDPHAPYQPPDNLKCKFNEQFCPLISNLGKAALETKRKQLYDCRANSPDDVELFKTLYDGEIYQADITIGKILDKLSEMKLDKNTIVVLYGDHGEGFDHNYYFLHGKSLYNSSVKIPLIIKFPAQSSGKTVGRLIDNTDILPTLLDILGINRNKQKFDGISFSGILSGNKPYQNNQPEKKDYVYLENNELTKYAVTDGRYKYIYSLGEKCLFQGQKEELYDLNSDPEELNNIINKKPETAADLQNRLINRLTAYGLPQNTKNFVIANPDPESDIDTLEKLKSLGY